MIKHILNPEQEVPLSLDLNEIQIIMKALITLRKNIKLPDPFEDQLLTEVFLYLNDGLTTIGETYYDMPHIPRLSSLTPEHYKTACKYIMPSFFKACLDKNPKPDVK